MNHRPTGILHARASLMAVVAVAAVAACSSPAATTPGTTGTTGPADTTGVTGTPAAPSTAGPAATAGGNGSGGATSARACDLLSDADLQEITSSPVLEKTDTAMDTIFANFCRWNLQGAEIDLGIISPGGRAWYDEHVAILNGLKPVSGLPADIAVLQELTGSIFAVKGDTYIDLFTLGVRAPDEDLVRRIIENLGG